MSERPDRQERQLRQAKSAAAPAGNEHDPSIELFRKVADYASVAAILLVGAFCIFRVPYWFPSREPTFDSPSYALGFNNRVAVLSVWAVAGVLCLRSLFWRQAKPEPVDAIFSWVSKRGPVRFLGMPISVLLLFIGLDFAITLCFYYCIPHLDEYFEAANLLQMFHVSIKYHLLPFRDIAWCYGPALFYIPVAFMRCSLFLGASAEIGYLVCLMFLSGLGYWLLFWVVDCFRIKVADRIVIYSSYVIFFLEMSMGVNGVLLRFVAPYAALLWIHRWSLKLAASRSPTAAAKLCGASLLCALAVLSLSVELGIAYVVAQAAYFAHRTIFGGRFWLFGFLGTAVCMPLWWLVFPESLEMVMGVSKGGYNMPIFPAVYMLLFLGSIFWLIPKLFRVCMTRQPGDDVSLILAWAMLLMCVIPASLGRCEFGHVAHYGIGIFLTTLAVSAKWSRQFYTIYALLFFVVYCVAGRAVNVAGLADVLQPVRMTLAGRHPVPTSQPSPLIAALHLDEVTGVAGPLGLDGTTRRYLIESGKYAPQYHPDYARVGTMADLDKKIASLSKASYVLVPEGILSLKGVSDEQIQASRQAEIPQRDVQQSAWLGSLYLYPIEFKTKHLPLDPTMIEARYIVAHYRTVQRANGWVLMKPEGPEPVFTPTP